ncbi:4-hydroxy-tetrahydrodipicolinate synthase [Nanoarchaeota archaeon]
MFKGVFTAIVTPFNEDGSIDEESFKKLIEYGIENGVSGIVPCGTTGESPTLDHDEAIKIIDMTVKQVNGRVPVIAGTGSNSTSKSVKMSQEAEKLGVSGLLLVNPYYNKPTQEGLYRHFKAIADAVKIPCVVYNIKGRTGVNVETSTLMRLIKDCPNINAVKEASGDINQIKEVISQAPEGFSILSGDDGLTFELIKSGGHGVISVSSNLLPKKMSDMVTAALNKDFEMAEQLNNDLAPLFKAFFIETNPIPIKAALAMKGMIKEIYRLPMCEMGAENKEKLKAALTEKGLL